MHQRHLLPDRAGRLDEVDAVIVVLLDPGRDGKDVRVEDDVFRGKPGLFGQQLVGPLADLDLAFIGVGLALFVEGHDDDGGTVSAHQLRLRDEGVFALLHRDRIDDRLALHAFEPRLDDRELG